MSDAFEIVGDPESPGRVVVTCEHACNLVPPPLQPCPGDEEWLASHWGWDIGAEDVVRELQRQTGAVSVLSRFSRLVCDPNRPCDHPTWIRTQIDGYPLGFNQHLNIEERERRRHSFHNPYHQAVDRVLRSCRRRHQGDVLLLSIHSFTPQLHGEVRTMEIGVLYSDYEAVAGRLAGLLVEAGFSTTLNEPYSGLAGLAYAAQNHGRNHGVLYLELEIRQDLISTPGEAHDVARRIHSALTRLRVRQYPR